MDVKYNKLWKLLIDKKMKKTDLIKVVGITSNIVAKLSKGEFISMESLKKICISLDCDIQDILELNFKD